MKKFISTLMSLVVCFSLIPATVVPAAPPPVIWETTMSEEDLANSNLSLGTISWSDDLVNGSVVVSVGPNDDAYCVKSEQYFKINDLAPLSKKDVARSAAKLAFMEIRDYAQINGWWDCKWKIKKTTKTKVTATAKVEYKAVKIDEHSKEMTIKQTTVKKNGRWQTTYTVNGKKVSLKKLKKMFI